MKRYFVRMSVLSFAAALVLGMGACSSSSGGDGDDSGIGTTSTALNGSAALSGTMATSGSSTPSASRIGATQVVNGVDEEALAELIVDGNADGVFGAPDVVYTSSVMSDGSFEFQNIEIPKEGTTQAQLTVSKEGYAPVTKIINLSDGQSTSVVAEAGTLPVFTEVVALDRNATTAGSYLKIGMKQSSTGISSYAKIMSLTELRAEAADPSFGEDELSTSVIPLDVIPDDVTEVRADMKAFDPTDPQDSKYFPGEYKGEGKDGSGDASRLVSVGFDLVSLRDQNGNPIELDTDALRTSKLRPQAIDYDNCLQTKVRYLSDTQVSLIEEMGDDDNATPEFEIPMWYYDYSSGMWRYLGEAEYTNATDSTSGKAYARMCITENWGEYLNLDYDFAITRPKTICVKAQDQFGDDAGGLNFTLKNGTAYSYMYVNSNGEGTLALTAGDTLSDYEISYAGSLTSWTNIQAPIDDVVANTNNEDCDYDLNVVVQNPYSTTLRVTPKDRDGSIGTENVFLKNTDYRDYYYYVATADDDGVATFKIKPNTSYTVRYRSQEVTINANGTVVAPETADSTRAVSVVVQDENVAPNVNVRFYNARISDRATSARFVVSTKDANGDTITFNGLTLNGTALVEGTHYTVFTRYSGDSYDYIYADLNLSNADVSAIAPASLSEGNYELKATYSDGTLNEEGSATLEVLGNRAPVINGVSFYSSGRYMRLDDVIPVGTYSVYVYAYDPNGDNVTLTYTLDGVAVQNTMDLTNGEHTIVVTASDGDLSTTRTFSVLVGNHPPVVTYAGAKSYTVDIASTNNKINLFAYVSDREDGSQVKSVQAVDQNGTKYPFTFNTTRWMYEAEVSPNAVGTYVFNVTATDNNDTNSSVYAVSVQTIANNQAPVFDTELLNETVNVNTEKIFTCEATDPEGTFVSYAWMIDDESQVTTSATLTHTFSTTGQVNISCTASDEDGESSTTSARITVIDPTQTGTLLVNTPMSGLLVSLHDSDTLEPIPGEEKVTNSAGSASFSVVGDRVSFSVSLTSDTVMSKDALMDMAKQFLIGDMMNQCANQPDTNTTCAEADWCALYAADTVPNWIIDLNPPRDDNGTIIATADEVDTNNDDVMDADELLAFELAHKDANSDGQITLGEFNDGENTIATQMYVSVPVQEYDLAFSLYNEEQYYGPASISYAAVANIDECEANNGSDFNLSITGLTPSSSEYFYASGSGYGYGNSPDANGSITLKVSMNKAGDNGKYSYMVQEGYNADGDQKYYFLETNASVLSEGVKVAIADFSSATQVNVSYAADQNEYFALNLSYNGLLFGTGARQYTQTGYLLNVFEIPNAQYLISTYAYVNQEGIGQMSYATNNYYGDGNLLGAYNIADYPQLDLSVSDVDGDFQLAGGDVGRLNAISAHIGADGENFNFHLSIVSTQVPTVIGDVNVSKVLPETVKGSIEGFSQEMLDTQYYSYGDITLTEYKDQTEVELLDTFTSTASYDFNAWLFVPQRSVRISLYGEDRDSASLISAKSTQETEQKVLVKNPFAIGLDVSKAW